MRLPGGSLTEALTPHLIGGDIDSMIPYSQLHFRRRPKWAELFRVRDCGGDVLGATNGYCIGQKFLESELTIVLLTLFKRKELSVEETKATVELCYRIRSIMAHLRASRVHNWTPPKRFSILSAYIALAKVEPPPLNERDAESPRKCKKLAAREQVWLEPPPAFGATLSTDVGHPARSILDTLSDSEADDGEDDDSVTFVESPSKSSDVVDLTPEATPEIFYYC